MRAAVTIALLVLVCARAERPDADEGSDACDVQRRPVISTLVTNLYTFRHTFEQVYSSSRYGENVTILCSADSAANLTIRSGDTEHEATEVNSTTIQLAIGQLDVGRHVYNCSDNNCEDSLIIDVEPRISVAAARERHIRIGLFLYYFVPVGEDYEVFCSGNEVENFTLYTESNKTLEYLPLNKFNRTAVMYKTRACSPDVRHYLCKDINSQRIKGADIYTKVIIDYFPTAQDFRCVSHEIRQLECSWTSLNEKNEYRLFFVHGNDTMSLCNDVSGDRVRLCKWDYHYWRDSLYDSALTTSEKMTRVNINQLPVLPLLIQACNEVFCHNETFNLNIESIVKLEPPPDLKVLNTSSNGAVISWRQPNKLVCYWIDPEYKLEYRLLGSPWQQGNMTSAQQDVYGDWIFELNLHCPDAHYEVKVYVKAKAASKEFWSEPSFISLSTQRGSEVKPECPGYNESKTLPTAEDKVYNVVRVLIAFVNIFY